MILGTPRPVLEEVALEDGPPVGDAEVRVAPQRRVPRRLVHAPARPRHLEKFVDLEVTQHLDQALGGQGDEGVVIVDRVQRDLALPREHTRRRLWGR